MSSGSDRCNDLLERLASPAAGHDRYEARGEIARGGMGVIWKVWDPHLRRQLAMKVMLARRESASADEQRRASQRAIARFLEEAQVTSQLDHPGIVPVHDVGVDSKGHVYFTMRLVHGRDFREVLDLVRERKDGWTLARALGVLLKVCEAVAYAHSKGVIHRDLKPANVMVGRFGEVYVMDWGLARVLARSGQSDTTCTTRIDTDVRGRAGGASPLLTLAGRVVGTPSYMSLEQARAEGEEIGPRSDVYAIGAMLYHLLTGQMPYAGAGHEATPARVHDRLLAGPPEPIRKLAPRAPDELVAICEKAMARDPRQRYGSPLEIAADVEAFLDRRPISAQSFSLRRVAALFFERNKALTLTVAAAVVALAGAAAFGWDQHLKQLQERALRELASARVLITSAEELFPATPERLDRFDAWLARARALLARAPRHRERLEIARADGRVGEIAVLEPALADLHRLEQELEPEIAAWRARAADLARLSFDVDDRKWQEAIADVAQLPVYRGLELTKQMGLVPLRRDPTSGLWEFWHVLSGERPIPDPADATRYALDEHCGLVLVLVPGGSCELGYPPEELLRNTSSELHLVDLEPAFVGKHEVTQAQWRRVMGANPSMYQEGIVLAVDAETQRPTRVSSPLHPVESVNWRDCVRFLRRLDLELPSEDLWEHAARGGAAGLYWWEPRRRDGDDPLELGLRDLTGFERRENVADASALESLGFGLVPWRDGFPFHAPIASFAPNGFGLFDVLGNVQEWCADARRDANVKVARRIVRGGHCFSTEPELLALSTRGWESEEVEQWIRGLRVARSYRRGDLSATR